MTELKEIIDIPETNTLEVETHNRELARLMKNMTREEAFVAAKAITDKYPSIILEAITDGYMGLVDFKTSISEICRISPEVPKK